MMPLKCCVPNCYSNYKSSDFKISAVYKFPREVSEKNKCFLSIPRSHWTVKNIALFVNCIGQMMLS